ncbi:hypothetical protein F5Y15DRAFT_381810 [Xylariaceae sp. FL0016]|nr:hypothetical protein F5Y15DRAFT_381810 [Xylariaceae sp. FL0016]
MLKISLSSADCRNRPLISQIIHASVACAGLSKPVVQMPQMLRRAGNRASTGGIVTRHHLWFHPATSPVSGPVDCLETFENSCASLLKLVHVSLNLTRWRFWGNRSRKIGPRYPKIIWFDFQVSVMMHMMHLVLFSHRCWVTARDEAFRFGFHLGEPSYRH